MVLIDAADIPKIVQITSSQLITCLLRICSFNCETVLDSESPDEQPEGPGIIPFSTPTCHTE